MVGEEGEKRDPSSGTNVSYKYYVAVTLTLQKAMDSNEGPIARPY